MEGIDQIIIKKAIIELRKRGYEIDPTEDDSELRMLFEYVGGIETGLEVLKALNGSTQMWTQLFTTIGNNIKSLQTNSNGTDVYFKTYYM
jgi:hypothetical protein